MNHHMPRILCIDDEPLNLSLLEAILTPRSFEVVTASNGPEALEKIRTERIDFCLLDVMMPGMDGFEVCRRIRAGKQGKDVRIISVTASAFTDDRSKMMAVGADDFIGKPFRGNELFEKIRRLLDLEYEYEQKNPEEADSGTGVTQESLAAMPPGLLAEIRGAIVEADVYRALAVIDLLEAHDAGIAGELRRLAKGYEYQTLLDLLPEGEIK